MIEKNARILIVGHETMIGNALVSRLKTDGYTNLIYSSSTNLLDQKEVLDLYMRERPEYVFLATAEEGGIAANMSRPADLIYKNLQMQTNLIHFAWKTGVKKLLLIASSCIYPRLSKQPIEEEYLLTGPLEPTNEAYAIAKIAGCKMCQAYNNQYGSNFISVVPANIYGPGDNFDVTTSHVIPANIRKFHEAKTTNKEVVIWGTGNPIREFLYVDDFVDACLFLMENYNSNDIINVGTYESVSIKELIFMIKELTQFDGKIIFDKAKPDGMPKKVLSTTKITSLGWKPETGLKEGLRKTYDWFKNYSAKSGSNL